MKLYAKYKLNCNDIVKDYCQKLIDSEWDYNTDKIFRISNVDPIVVLLNNEMIEHGLPGIRAVSIFCRGKFNNQVIHKDTMNDNFDICHSGFYIPLISAESKLVWFNPDSGVDIKGVTRASANSTNIATTVLKVVYDNSKLHVIGEYTEHDPVIICTHIPHRAETTNGPRAAISIRLTDNVDLFQHFNL
jgi:hypothetical protein